MADEIAVAAFIAPQLRGSDAEVSLSVWGESRSEAMARLFLSMRPPLRDYPEQEMLNLLSLVHRRPNVVRVVFGEGGLPVNTVVRTFPHQGGILLGTILDHYMVQREWGISDGGEERAEPVDESIAFLLSRGAKTLAELEGDRAAAGA
jgi:hypothetical protein